MHYLDYAATAAIRPDQVGRAVMDYLSGVAASPGRGGHRTAVEAGRIAFRARRSLARLMGLPGDPGRVAFTLNATHALNLAMHGVLRPGDVLVVTAFDHNAVLRPARLLADEKGIEVRMVPGDSDGSLAMDHLDEMLDGARLFVVNEVSNVLGTRLPLEDLASRAHDAGALVLLDAAQSAGHGVGMPAEKGADLIAFAGHKGLLGPQGTGALWVREGLDLAPLIAGGTGGDSRSKDMPSGLPDRLEAGTPNMPGIAGLLAALDFLRTGNQDELHRKEMDLKARLRDGLAEIRGVRILSPPAPDGVGIVTITSDAMDPPTLARRLEEDWGVVTRTGLHCAPEVHRILGTQDAGAVRFSLGWASTAEDVDQALAGVEALVRPARFGSGPVQPT
jgi:cysteine desulfurase/selenocysteine lyase